MIQQIEVIEKKKPGPKIKYRDDFPEILLAQMSDGLSFEACCGFLEISKDSGYKYIKEYPEFAAAKALGEVKGQLFWEKAAIGGMYSDKDNKFNTTAFIFVMKNRFNWRDRKEITGNLGIGLGLDNIYRGMSANQIENTIGEILARLPKPEGPKIK